MIAQNSRSVNMGITGRNRHGERKDARKAADTAKSPSFASHGHMPEQDPNPKHIGNDAFYSMTRDDDDDLLFWG